MTIRLYDFPRSSACYRVRIALNLKGLAYEVVPTSLITGDNRDPAYVALNAQGFVPTLDIDGAMLTQSLAIIDYLEVTRPEPALLPADPVARAQAIAMALVVAADIHPIQNLRILKFVESEFGGDRAAWARQWISEGFEALEAMATDAGDYLIGDTPSLADICLIPQMANARRFEVDLTPYPTLVRVDETARAHPAFAAAHPDAVTQF